MNTMSKVSLRSIALGIALGAASIATTTAHAEWRGPYGGHLRGPTVVINGGWGWGWGWGAPWPGYYGYYGYSPYSMGPPYLIERNRAEAAADAGLEHLPAPPQYWYFCEASGAYYPYVSACPAGWKPVPVVPMPSPTNVPSPAPSSPAAQASPH
jgi:hypothetical protein